MRRRCGRRYLEKHLKGGYERDKVIRNASLPKGFLKSLTFDNARSLRSSSRSSRRSASKCTSPSRTTHGKGGRTRTATVSSGKSCPRGGRSTTSPRRRCAGSTTCSTTARFGASTGSRVTDPCKPLEFDLSRPLEIEVGCGKGKFLTSRAAENPDCDFLGIERMLERVRLFDGKCRRV